MLEYILKNIFKYLCCITDCRKYKMGEDGTFYKAVFILGITFTAGFVAGYKVTKYNLTNCN